MAPHAQAKGNARKVSNLHSTTYARLHIAATDVSQQSQPPAMPSVACPSTRKFRGSSSSESSSDENFIGHPAELDEDIGVGNLLSGARSGESQQSFSQWIASREPST